MIVHKFDFTVDEGKERLNPSREKKKGTHRRKKMDHKSCVTLAGTSNEFNVHDKWEENTHAQHISYLSSRSGDFRVL